MKDIIEDSGLTSSNLHPVGQQTDCHKDFKLKDFALKPGAACLLADALPLDRAGRIRHVLMY